MQVLIVEDDLKLAANLGEYLEEQGDTPDYASDGQVGIQLCACQTYDAIVLDLRLPRLDGIRVCQQLRAQHRSGVPILMLTARDTVEDRIEGFEAGTDDYLVKPFSLREMYLRLCAIVRRQQPSTDEEWQVGALRLDLPRHAV
jgi:DNA-binding response OmpR family regulator